MHTDTKKNIAIVEDETDIREELAFILEKEGYIIKSFEHAKSFIEYSELSNLAEIDLLIADIMMPGMNGDKMVAKLSEEEKLNYTPVLFLSALGEDDDINRAHDAGKKALSVDYLRKPFQTGWLLARVDNLLRLREYRLALTNAYNEIKETNMLLNRMFSEESIKSQNLKQLNNILNRENTSIQSLLITTKDVFRKIIMNDLPLVKFVASIVEKNEHFIAQTVTGGDEGGELFKVLSRATEPLKTVAADIEQVVQLLLSIGFLNRESIKNNDLKNTSFYEILYKIYERGGFSSELFAEFLQFAQLDLDTSGEIELF